MKLTIRPLTPDLWPALEDLFGKNGACFGCWCMYWRIGRLHREQPASKNKAAFREIVMRGPPPGLLAFDGDKAVGWCQLTPRGDLPWLERTWRLKRVDDVPVWCISCFYIRIGYRKRGITSALIKAALKAAKRAGAPVWCISCFYIRIGYRKRGITSALIKAALKAAKRAGAPALEAYPLDADLTPSASGTGFATTFTRLGFKTIARHVPPRPIMRYDLKHITG